MSILIVYGTSEGQTRKIAAFLARRLEDAGHAVTLADAIRQPVVPRASDFDAVIVAARVHAGRYPREVVRFVRANRAALGTMPNVFVSVSKSAARLAIGDDQRLQKYVGDFLHRTGWAPARVFHVAGARLYTRHGALGRWILGLVDGNRFSTNRDYEWTDWAALETFADEFAAGLPPGHPEGVARTPEPLDALD